MYCIVYSSVATRLFDEAELRSLLVHWRTHNHHQNISGVLLYGDDGSIIQVLEGERAAVEEVFAQIKHDCRHFNVVKMADGAVTARVFADWSMGFTTVSKSEFAQLSGYLDLNAPNFLTPHAMARTRTTTILRALLQDFVAAMPQLPSWLTTSVSGKSPSGIPAPSACSEAGLRSGPSMT